MTASPSPARDRVSDFIVARYGQILGTIRRSNWSLPQELAEDVAQDTLVIALIHADRIAELEDAQLWCWIAQTALRQAKDRRRRKSFRSEVGDDTGVLVEANGGASDMSRVEWQIDLSRDIAAAAGKFGGTQSPLVAQALLLVVMGGAKVGEAATATGARREYVSRAVGALRVGVAA